MLLTKQDMKALRKEAKKTGSNWLAGGGKPAIYGAHKAFYVGTELPDGQCGGQGAHVPLVFGYESHLGISVTGQRTLVIGHGDISSWRLIPAGDVPGYRGKATATKAAEAVLGGALGAASSAAEERANAGRSAIAVPYSTDVAEGTLFVTFARDKELQKLESHMRTVLGKPTYQEVV